jgi:hypothetical protein
MIGRWTRKQQSRKLLDLTVAAVSLSRGKVHNLQQQSAAQFKTLTDYERKSFFAKLFGGGPR